MSLDSEDHRGGFLEGQENTFRIEALIQKLKSSLLKVPKAVKLCMHCRYKC